MLLFPADYTARKKQAQAVLLIILFRSFNGREYARRRFGAQVSGSSLRYAWRRGDKL